MSNNKCTPEAFVSGWRGHLVMTSRELAEWMEIDNAKAHSALLWQNGNRPPSWWIGNCWNKSEVFRLNRSAGTFTVITSYWISESVAMKLCRTFRRDLLPSLRQIFAKEYENRLARRAVFAGHSRLPQQMEARA